MKLPLRWGVFSLAGLVVMAGWFGPGPGRSLVLLVAIGVALWTAFSLNITPRSVLEQPPPEEAEETPGRETSTDKVVAQRATTQEQTSSRKIKQRAL